ncbi:hypothetical protein [Actinokineospora iranica]|uniref:Uncharacterized protein n=1 Tax=Actinokineospora iranica TaxID=1271860 RepID=A0A1G6JL33_9PSEU|nr:hypothetical protein [Actinokineospora iranica]SDC19135.1 hypothetical protein SAMN05216174_101446 [Actinokineospora iranica]
MGLFDDFLAAQEREALLEGIHDDLIEPANRALDACDYLLYATMPTVGVFGELLDERKPRVAAVFRLFSETDIGGLQDLIDQLDRTWRELDQGTRVELEEAQRLLTDWNGSAAEETKYYLARLTEAFDLSVTNISEVEGGVVAARELIATARNDLTTLAESFHDAAKQYHESQNPPDDNLFGRVLVAAFAGAITGLLTAGVGVGVAGAATISYGAAAASSAAGAAITTGLEASITGSVSGDDPLAILESFLTEADKLKSGTRDAADELTREIQRYSASLPVIPAPPDVSPGPTFDPDLFRTDNLTAGLEESVRRAQVDIPRREIVGTQDGQAQPGGSGTVADRLDGGPAEPTDDPDEVNSPDSDSPDNDSAAADKAEQPEVVG